MRGGATLMRTLCTGTPIAAPTCRRRVSVTYRRRDAQGALATPMVNRPCSSPALTTVSANLGGKALQTCSRTTVRSCALILSAPRRLPPARNNSLILRGFCTLLGTRDEKLDVRSVHNSL